MKITIVGTGYDAKSVTCAGFEACLNADVLLLKTEKTPSADFFKERGLNFRTLDAVYDSSRNFETLNKNILKFFKSLDKNIKNIVYCVPGSGVRDRSALLLSEHFETVFISAPECTANISSDISGDVKFSFAEDFVAEADYKFDYFSNLVITEIDDKYIAGDVKIALLKVLDGEDKIIFADAFGCRRIPLMELDRQNAYYAHTAVLVNPKDILNRKTFSFADLTDLVIRLRAPDGCPWDRVQTHESLRKNALEEAYEVAEAIDLKDSVKLEEELGDLLLQSVLNAVIAEEEGDFTVADIVSGICRKIISRHTHIFGSESASDSESALVNWEKEKHKEKGFNNYYEEMIAVPKPFPALMRAQKIQKKAKNAGMDFKDKEDAEARLYSELEEYKKSEASDTADELGDVLFSVVNICRLNGEDAEECLCRATEKFISRFKKTEDFALKNGKTLKDYTYEELDELWKKSKNL